MQEKDKGKKQNLLITNKALFNLENKKQSTDEF